MPIKMQPEPPHFYKKVQKKGETFLARCPAPSQRDWSKHAYWQAIIEDLYDAYGGICAYTCVWTSPDTGWKTVEHFRPKNRYPQEAYLWRNYRFVCGTMNGRKSDHEDVLDPFILQDGWFEMVFPSLQLKSGCILDQTKGSLVQCTIKRLQLNGAACIKGRKDWLTPYLQEKYPFSYLEEKAPFLAFEIKRQELMDIEHPIWAAFKKPCS